MIMLRMSITPSIGGWEYKDERYDPVEGRNWNRSGMDPV